MLYSVQNLLRLLNEIANSVFILKIKYKMLYMRVFNSS